MPLSRERRRVAIDFSDSPSRTKQQFAKECDINHIMAKYKKTGFIEHVRSNPGQFVDLPDQVEYHEALNLVLEARSAFDTMPGTVRRRFNDDPREFLAFMEDPANEAEARELGILPPPQTVSEDPPEPGEGGGSDQPEPSPG